jgi:hypothetical protein
MKKAEPTMPINQNNRPKIISITVAGVTFVVLLFPTCFNLAPLGKKYRAAADALDKAESAETAAKAALITAQNNLATAKQEIVDLSCAIKNVFNFNQKVLALAGQLEAASSVTDKLAVWGLRFLDDRTVKTTSSELGSCPVVVEKCHEECTTGSKGHEHCEDECHLTTQFKPYTEITYLTQYFKNILQALDQGLISFKMNCGEHSRELALTSPIQYLASHDSSQTGECEFGLVTVTTKETYLSELPTTFELDSTTNHPVHQFSASTSVQAAASGLATALSQWVTQSLTAFEAIGAPQYRQLRTSVNETLPTLAKKITQAQAVVANTTKVVAKATTVADEAWKPYRAALIRWLPLLLLGTLAVGIISFLLAKFLPRTHCPTWWKAKPTTTTHADSQYQLFNAVGNDDTTSPANHDVEAAAHSSDEDSDTNSTTQANAGHDSTDADRMHALEISMQQN